MNDFDKLNNRLTIKCKRCGEQFPKYQELKFTFILQQPYIKCTNCGKKYYLKLD